MSAPNLLDIAKQNAASDVVGLIEVNQSFAPEVQEVPAITINGYSYTTLLRTSVPEGGFHEVGAGIVPGKSEWDNKLVQTFPYSNPLEIPDSVARQHRLGRTTCLEREASGAVKGCLQHIGKQFYYGDTTPGDSKGHPGLIDMYDSTNMVQDAGGTTGSTGSSVWFVCFGDEYVNFVFGGDGNTSLTFGTWAEQMLSITATQRAGGWVNELKADVGVQCVNPYAVCRIKKITEDAGKTLTDALGYLALAKFPVGIVPNVAFMTRRSRRQLQVNRTIAGYPGSAGAAGSLTTMAPLPTDIAGVRIVVTDSLLNTEALTL